MFTKLRVVTANLINTFSHYFQHCLHRCHIYTHSFKHGIIPVSRRGLCDFLCKTFITSQDTSKPRSSENILSTLKNVPNARTAICGQLQSIQSPGMKNLHATLLQLLTKSIVYLGISDDTPSAVIIFSVQDRNASPNYLYGCYWFVINLLDWFDLFSMFTLLK